MPYLHLGEFYNIAGAVINRYHPLVLMEEANAELARELLDSNDSSLIFTIALQNKQELFRV